MLFDNAEQVIINDKEVKSIKTNEGVIYERPSLSLTLDKSVIQKDESVTLTATYTDFKGNGIPGKTVTFYVEESS